MNYITFGIKSAIVCVLGCSMLGGMVYSIYLAGPLGYWFMWAGVPISFGVGVALIDWVVD